MRSAVLVAVLLLAGTDGAAAQVREWQVQALGIATGERFAGGGVGFAVRALRTRIGLSASVGALDGAFAGRGELLVSYHLNPTRRRGVTPYAGAGAAVVVTRDASREFVVALLGVEGQPGARAGWFAEVGVGGGVRIAAGARIRTRRRR